MRSGKQLRIILKFVVIALVMLGLFAAVIFLFKSFQITYRAAYSTSDHMASKLLQSLGQAANEEKTWVAFKRVPVNSLEDAARALETGRAEIAVVRPDVALPAKSANIATLRREAVYLIVPAKSPIESLSDLKGRTVAILTDLQADETLLNRLLDHYSVPRESVRRVRMQAADVADSIRRKSSNAVFMIDAPESAQSVAVFAAVTKATKEPADIVGVDDAEAIAKRFGNVGTVEIAHGVFPGSSPRPEEAVTTLAITYSLMASRNLSNMAVGEIARVLLAAKTRLGASDPAANSIEVPDTDDRSLNLHPGAKAFYDGEQPSFFDSFESMFWIGYIFLGLIGSGFAWILSRLARGNEDKPASLDRLAAFLIDVRGADELKLTEMKETLDDFVASMVRDRADGTLDPEEFESLSIAVTYARQAVTDRRDSLHMQYVAEPSKSPTDAKAPRNLS